MRMSRGASYDNTRTHSPVTTTTRYYDYLRLRGYDYTSYRICRTTDLRDSVIEAIQKKRLPEVPEHNRVS